MQLIRTGHDVCVDL